MRASRCIVTAAVTLLALSAVRAEEPTAKYDPRFAFGETDTSRDAKVDREEFHVRIVQVFYEADVNKDGTLAPDEVQRLTFPDDMKTADSDHNGRITLHEFLRVRYLDYEAADGDKDGLLSIDEVVGAYEGRKK